MSALGDETERDGILRELARATYAKAHDGAECPRERFPRCVFTDPALSVEALLAPSLSEWLSDGPKDARDEADKLLSELFGCTAVWTPHTPTRGGPFHALIWRDIEPGDGVSYVWLTSGGEQLAASEATVEAVHLAWLAMPEPRRRHPLAPLVASWQVTTPVKARAVTDYDRPLILSRQFATVRKDAEGYYLQRFKTAAHRARGQLLLGFEHPDMEGPTLPADVWNMHLADAEKRGPGLPAALRIFIASIVHVPLEARASADPFTPPVMLMGPDGRPWTLRRFLGLIYRGRTRPGEFWPVLWGAREVLHSIEMQYEWNGRIWSRPVLRMDWPQSVSGGYETSMLDEPWPVSVHLPPGDGNGAPVNWDRLRQLMTRDAAAARALVNLAYRWHIEGKRLMPAPGKSVHWLQRRAPKLYDRITDRLSEQLCFPPGTGRARQRDRIADARAALERLVKAGDAVSVDGRLLPPVPWERKRPS